MGFCENIKEFEYTIYKTELKIHNIFLRNFNEDIYFRPSDPEAFVKELLETLRSKVDNVQNFS